MNFVEIMGGLGNQMFQYAFARYLEKKTSHALLLYTNFYDYVKNDPSLTQREFYLDKFNTQFISVRGSINYRNQVYENKLYEYDHQYMLDLFRGYWQDKKYFYEIKNDLKNELTLKDEFIPQIPSDIYNDIRSQDSVSLHIRLTDYNKPENKKHFVSLGENYYKNALNLLKERTDRLGKLFIFSDDTDSVRERFKFIEEYDHVFMPCRAAYEDMYLMSLCKHHIIANSTFSWWGAALSKGEDSITICPLNWFKDMPSDQLILDNWLSI